MMGREEALQNQLFGLPKDLGARVPEDHLLRRISGVLDLEFAYEKVGSVYGAVGNESIPPPTIIKMMLLLALYNVSSERAFFRSLPMRVDWLWFLGYGWESEIPNHSVLSKARRRWGAELFDRLFQESVDLCEQAGLIHGEEILIDSSLVDANASIDSMFTNKLVTAALERLDDLESTDTEQQKRDPPSGESSDTTESSDHDNEPKYRSRTDPDATGAKRRGERHARPRYQTHRVVDAGHGVITATTAGPGHQNEGHRLPELVEQHTKRTHRRVDRLCADSQYGTADLLEYCEFNRITAYIPPLRDSRIHPKPGTFTECCFVYDAETDTYCCPAGQTMARSQYRTDRDAWRYSAPKGECATCAFRIHCTESNHGRSVSRQQRQEILDRATAQIKTVQGRRYRKKRKSMMEGSFAQSTRFGYKRARGRGLANMIIQDYLVASAQNLMIRVGWNRGPRKAQGIRQTASHDLLAAYLAPIRFFLRFLPPPRPLLLATA